MYGDLCWGLVLSILSIVAIGALRGSTIARFCSVVVVVVPLLAPLLAQWLCHVFMELVCLVMIALTGAQ